MTVAHGPYEHIGAYADRVESEQFDTSGVSNTFCPDCEHDPCIAEYRRPSAALRNCVFRTPRELSVGRVRWPIVDAGTFLTGDTRKMYEAAEPAIYHLSILAIANRDDRALDTLVEIREGMRKVVAK
jgi:hypothetical protein